MSAHLLISGRLFKKPETRCSKNGRDFATATIVDRDGEGGNSRFFRIVAFDEAAIAELARLEEGDACSATGAFSIETYEARDGEKKTAMKIIADRVVGLRPIPKKRNPKTPSPSAVRDAGGPRAWEFDDDINLQEPRS